MRVQWISGVALACSLLGGCAVAGLGGSTAAPATFNLLPAQVASVPPSRLGGQVMVAAPSAIRALDTERILVSSPGGRISYFSDAAWSDRLPRLVHSRLVEALQDSGAFRAVLTTQDRVDGDFAIATEIRAFQLDVDNGNTAATVKIFAKILDERRGKVLATREFSARVPAGKDDAAASVAALQDGFSRVAGELVRWAASPRGGTNA
jgi:cholesterol transport system auxiliary component